LDVQHPELFLDFLRDNYERLLLPDLLLSALVSLADLGKSWRGFLLGLLLVDHLYGGTV
jgi:hypothetical protein